MGTNITGIGNVNAIGFKSRVTGGIYFPPELKDALVGVWSAYGKSNDSTDRNIIKNKIKDRGGDFVISNAAFKLNSGFGKYEEDFTDWKKSPKVTSFDGESIKFTSDVSWVLLYHPSSIGEDIPSFKVRIKLYGEGALYYNYITQEGTYTNVIVKSEIFETPICYNTKYTGEKGVNVGFTLGVRSGECSGTITQIPSFEGAFVTDGINDLITSTKTVQEMLGGSSEITVVSMIHQIGFISSRNYARNNYFIQGNDFLTNTISAIGKIGIYGYKGNLSNIAIVNDILGNKKDYSVHKANPANIDSVFSVNGTHSSAQLSQIAWYWTIIANKVLTTDQINQVIAYYNLDKYVKPDIYYNVKKQGLTNDTPDEDWYLKDFSGNGRDMTLYNYARTPESGINEEGGLQSDGVVDYGQFVGDLGLKDYTVVIDRAYNNLINNQVPLISSNIVEDQTPFIVEHWNTGSNAISFSYGASRITDIPLDINKKIVYQSTYSYMGYVIPKGNAISTGGGITLGKFGNGVQYSAICLWSLMLFPYSMSEFLIERQLKKHKLGTLYPDMVEFRPVIKSNASYDNIVFYYKNEKVENGTYLTVGSSIGMHISLSSSPVNEIKSITVNGIPATFKFHDANNNIYQYDFNLTSKSPQKINITIDEYIRFEDIVQPYPVLLRFKDENGNEVSWGGKFRVGSTITRIGSIADPESNLLNGLYSISGLSLNGKGVTSSTSIVEKQMVFKSIATYLLDNNEPKCILSPRLLRIPNSSYKILGYIPDISGHGNHGKINNSAYAERSGVNEDGSYQFDGVDDFVTIPTLSSGGKQVLMKVNWSTEVAKGCLYDQRKNIDVYEFAIFNLNTNNTGVSVPAYQARNDGKTYIDGILNNNILAGDLKQVLHNITITNELVRNADTVSPTIGNTVGSAYYTNMALYDFMLFDEISTDEEILNLNKYISIEPKVELPPYYWDAYGKTNLDADKATIQQRGVAVGDYDITNYNHAYDKMSGYGGYKFAKFDNAIEWFAEDSSMVVNRNGYLITLKKVPNVAFWRFRNTTLKSLDNPLTFKVKCNKPIDVIFQVKFAKNNDVSIGYNYNIKEVTLVPNESTTIIVPSVSVSDIPEATSILFINVLFDNTSLSDNEEYTVEMLPLYPNGLVYDAITDYSENVNIPVFTDFTAIMKRKWLKNQGCPLIKGSKVYEGGNGNALLLEWDKAYNFVFYKRTDIMEGEVPENISFITPTNYNGNVITRGSGQDTNGICIAGDGNAGFANMVFYKLILYPKTIPLLQINFLKNLMERDEIIDLNNPILIKNE
jgi:hypothetical protein